MHSSDVEINAVLGRSMECKPAHSLSVCTMGKNISKRLANVGSKLALTRYYKGIDAQQQELGTKSKNKL
jgi:hypothetical protein